VFAQGILGNLGNLIRRSGISHLVLAGVAGYHQQQGNERSASVLPCRHGRLLPGIPTTLIVRKNGGLFNDGRAVVGAP